ncbi:MAG: hypothetical protein K2X68_07080 [Novosphingobium sp.]|nr:hypothetical protein [Novosphingobium sp.]
MTAFIESFSTDQLLPPWLSTGMRMWSFIVPVDRQLIEAHLKTHFNDPAPDQAPYFYTPMPGKTYGLLCVAQHETLSSIYEKKFGPDTVSHTELYWTFPVIRSRVNAENLRSDPEQVWIQPFAFDNSSYVMFSAREIWGTEMEMAAINLAEGSTPGDLGIDMAIEGMARFDPKARSQSIGCMRMGLKPTATKADLHALLQNDDDLNAFVDLLIGAGVFTGGFDDAGPGGIAGMEVNTLRQFRDVFDMDCAAYRAIVASRTKHGNIRDLAFFSGEDTVVEFLLSDSMKETFQAMFGQRVSYPRSQLPAAPPQLQAPGTPPTNWALDHMPIEVALVLSYTADAQYKIERTLHTYGQIA